MNMYLEHFGFTQQPFQLTPDTGLFLGLDPHYEAIQTVSAALQMGEGVIKVTGEIGTGKTMVCRMLLTHLKEYVQLIYLPNPALNGDDLRTAIAKELNINECSKVGLVEAIQARLIESHCSGKRVVALLDEAQALSDEALEVLRLFGNLETEQTKLLQLVLIGQPELDERLEQYHLRQFRQRITFSAKLRSLDMAETVAYIDNRLSKSGYQGELFSLNQKKAIWKACQGTPRLINQVCHKTLLLAFYEKTQRVKNQQLYAAIHDTYDTCKPKHKTPVIWGWSH